MPWCRDASNYKGCSTSSTTLLFSMPIWNDEFQMTHIFFRVQQPARDGSSTMQQPGQDKLWTVDPHVGHLPDLLQVSSLIASEARHKCRRWSHPKSTESADHQRLVKFRVMLIHWIYMWRFFGSLDVFDQLWRTTTFIHLHPQFNLQGPRTPSKNGQMASRCHFCLSNLNGDFNTLICVHGGFSMFSLENPWTSTTTWQFSMQNLSSHLPPGCAIAVAMAPKTLEPLPGPKTVEVVESPHLQKIKNTQKKRTSLISTIVELCRTHELISSNIKIKPMWVPLFCWWCLVEPPFWEVKTCFPRGQEAKVEKLAAEARKADVIHRDPDELAARRTPTSWHQSGDWEPSLWAVIWYLSLLPKATLACQCWSAQLGLWLAL